MQIKNKQNEKHSQEHLTNHVALDKSLFNTHVQVYNTEAV